MSAERILAEFLDRGGHVSTENGQLNLRSPKGAMDAPLRDALKRHKNELIELIGTGRTFGPISSQERRLWYLQTHEGAGNAYNMDLAFRIEGPLEPGTLHEEIPSIDQVPPPYPPASGGDKETPIASTIAKPIASNDNIFLPPACGGAGGETSSQSPQRAKTLIKALTTLLQRHETLRTAYPVLDGKPYRAVMATVPFAPEFHDLSSLSIPRAEDQAARVGEACSKEPFDLIRPPLMRAAIVRIAPHLHYLFLVLHHIAADGGAIQIFVQEFAEIYRALAKDQAPVLPELTSSFSDCLDLSRAALATQLPAQLAYWSNELAGEPPQAELPADRPFSPNTAHPGRRLENDIPDRLHEEVKQWAREHETTVFSVLLAAFAALLRRYASQNDILVGITSALRKQPGAEKLIGFFANTLPIRLDFAANPGFASLAKTVHRKVREAQEREDTPFEQILAVTKARRQPGLTPLVHALFSMHKIEQMAFDAPHGVRFQRIGMDRGTAKAPLAVVIAIVQDRLRGIVEYDADLFDRATIERLWTHYLNLLDSGIHTPDTGITLLPILAETERQQILHDWNATQTAFPAEDLLPHQCVARHAAATPDAIALVAGNATLTYAALEQRVAQLAQRLQAHGIGPDRFVGVCLRRSPEMVIAHLAVWKTGAAYIALDPNQPESRIRAAMQDAASNTILTHPQETAKYQALGFQAIAVLPTAKERHDIFPAATNPDNAAYAIFTSGSTGRPKGVVIEHRSLQNLCSWFATQFALTPQDRMSCQFNPSFDALASEVVPCLYAGATLLFPDEMARYSAEALREWLLEQRITICSVPTIMAESLIQLEWPENTPLRCLVTGGDRLRHGPPARLPFRFFNVYGPTENTIISTFHEVTEKHPDSPPPIGKPIANTQAYILDKHAHLVPAGVCGELYLGGAQLAQGYLNRPELTAAAFVPNPFGEGRLYRTGDLCRFRADGLIEFLGRCDSQVQLRGYRIELGEIEHVLTGFPGIIEAVASMKTQPNGENRLLAYITISTEIDPAALRRTLREQLPEYMVPSQFIVLPEMPLTENAKIDRKRLTENPPEGKILEFADSGHVPPRDALEQQIADIWAELLDAQSIGVFDDFFALGGHSLLATQVVSRIRKSSGVEFALSDFFAAPHIAAIAERVRASAITADAVLSQPRNTPERTDFLEHLDQLSEEHLEKTLRELSYVPKEK